MASFKLHRENVCGNVQEVCDYVSYRLSPSRETSNSVNKTRKTVFDGGHRNVEREWSLVVPNLLFGTSSHSALRLGPIITDAPSIVDWGD